MNSKKDVERLLDEEIRSRFDRLHKSISPASDNDGRDIQIKELEALYRLRIDEKRVNAENAANEAAHKAEATDRRFKLGVDIAAILIPVLSYSVWLTKGFEFEKSGSFTSMTFKNLFNKLRPGR